jgi:hypothetical protein
VRKKNERHRRSEHSPSKTKRVPQVRSHKSVIKIEQELDALVNSFASDREPEILYHYTTWHGAEGILTNRQVWATAQDCTDDKAELHSVDEIILTVARDLCSCFGPRAQAVLTLFLDNYTTSHVTNLASHYLACFSEARNKESQWRCYADQGRGLCLGIRLLRDREEKPPDGNPLCRWLRVDYSQDSWKARLKEYFSDVCLRLNATSPKNFTDEQRALRIALDALYRIAALASLSAKEPKWASEEEWRIVTLVPKGKNPSPLQRCKDGKCINYLELTMRQENKPLFLDEILIGPNQDVVEAQHRLQGLLKRVGYPHESAPLPKMTFSSVVWKD